MKASTTLKILGFCMIPIGITLIALGCTVFAYHHFNHSWYDWVPHLGAVIPGIFMCFLSIPLLVLGFKAPIDKIDEKLNSETIDNAGKTIGKAVNKTVDTVGPAIKKVVESVKHGFKPQIYCKYCGKSIDSDSQFCKHCSRQL